MQKVYVQDQSKIKCPKHDTVINWMRCRTCVKRFGEDIDVDGARYVWCSYKEN